MMKYLRFIIFALALANLPNFQTLAAALSTIEDQLNYATVKIKTSLGSGTGFFFNFDIPNRSEKIPCLITNKHVKKDSRTGSITFHLQNSEGNPNGTREHVIQEHLWKWVDHPLPDVDLCGLPLGPILEEMESMRFRPFWRNLTPDLIIQDADLARLTPVNTILMVGYPIGLTDGNNFPIFRQGITATHPNINFEGKPQFLIDAACWPGSSGSPIFLRGPLQLRGRTGIYIGADSHIENKLLGVLWGGPVHAANGTIIVQEIPMVQVPIAETRIPINLGFAIHAREVLEIGRQILG